MDSRDGVGKTRGVKLTLNLAWHLTAADSSNMVPLVFLGGLASAARNGSRVSILKLFKVVMVKMLLNLYEFVMTTMMMMMMMMMMMVVVMMMMMNALNGHRKEAF